MIDISSITRYSKDMLNNTNLENAMLWLRACRPYKR